ncbi:MAG: glutamine-hydrolyzing GMP synthase [Candidatus Lokiarchaeota archaeon]|nr:glutamine-hydrolyzing GMP synthase [Candidatus Lokiarchaeota archaeon]
MFSDKPKIIILDFGGQYVFNFKRILFEIGINSEIVPYDIPAAKIDKNDIKGIILSGGPYSVYNPGSPLMDVNIYDLGIPILGICYGNQLIAKQFNGEVKRGESGEFGFTKLEILNMDEELFKNVKQKSICWMSHSDRITKIPDEFEEIASTPQTRIAAIKSQFKPIYGLQWHVEVTHTEEGLKILKNFIYNICGCKIREWNIDSFIENSIKEIKEQIGNKKAICAVSGGVDSSTVAVLVNKILGSEKLHCIHINNGMMRINESNQVMKFYRDMGLNVKYIDASVEFLNELKGIIGSDEKRSCIGETFIKIFEGEAKKIDAKYLIQATIMPDIIESTRGESKKIKDKKHGGIIKIHHNVGGLPEKMGLKVIEPIKTLFKYQVRMLARKLNLPKKISERQPQPGPAGAVRILGPLSAEKIKIWQEANQIVEDSLKKFSPAQYFAVLLPNQYLSNEITNKKVKKIVNTHIQFAEIQSYIFSTPTVGIKGDERAYKNTLGLNIRKNNKNHFYSLDKLDILNLQSSLTGKINDIVRISFLLSETIDTSEPYIILVRSVETKDFMTATPSFFPNDITKELNNQLLKLKSIGAVFYDCTTKPSATIEYI